MLKPISEIVTVEVPPLIDQATFDAVQAHLRSRNPKVTQVRVVSGPALLTGICFCADCGGAMTLRTGKGGRYRLKRLYDAIEAGVAALDDPALKERVTSLKAIRDQAQADAERAAAMLESSVQQAITPQMVRRFATTARERIRMTAAATAATISARSPSASRSQTARSASSARRAICFRHSLPRPARSRLRPAFAVLF